MKNIVLMRNIATAVLLVCLVLPLGKCSIGSGEADLSTLTEAEEIALDKSQSTNTQEKNTVDSIKEDNIAVGSSQSRTRYLYIFPIMFFDFTDIGSYTLPLAFVWPSLIFLFRRFKKNKLLPVAEVILCGFTSWVLFLVAIDLEVMIGWYLAVVGTSVLWISAALDSKKMISDFRKSRQLNDKHPNT